MNVMMAAPKAIFECFDGGEFRAIPFHLLTQASLIETTFDQLIIPAGHNIFPPPRDILHRERFDQIRLNERE
jgi:hypothetical protein